MSPGEVFENISSENENYESDHGSSNAVKRKAAGTKVGSEAVKGKGNAVNTKTRSAKRGINSPDKAEDDKSEIHQTQAGGSKDDTLQNKQVKFVEPKIEETEDVAIQGLVAGRSRRQAKPTRHSDGTTYAPLSRQTPMVQPREQPTPEATGGPSKKWKLDQVEKGDTNRTGKAGNADSNKAGKGRAKKK
ncbi:hypothetical protein BDN72DRAFT_865343 [Pluteus cervinus]|uniref:Uncharacterized protein n=1 Tax=Pluteus cervinus TaxID=181527 RepID=A0ACD3A039_9AGAR|nr:hypothetical protein BDN72DRAFT_865343 [Pluteus cervinus]